MGFSWRAVVLSLAQWFFYFCLLVWTGLCVSWRWLRWLMDSIAVSCKFKTQRERKKVVIIGGGFAGSMVASKLEPDFDVTLIDPKPYTEFTPSILRVLVEEEHTRNIRMNHSRYLKCKCTKIIQDEVKDLSFDPKIVVTSSNATLEFDYVVICTGSSSRSNLSGPKIYRGDSHESLVMSRQDLARAKRVLIMGGGSVGVELAGEILDRYPEKKVILSQAGTLLNRYPSAAGSYAAKQLQKRGVTIVNERILSQLQVGVFQTESGEYISADVAYSCVGAKPNSTLLQGRYAEFLNDSGYARVDDYLQFEASSAAFIAGDLLCVNEEKLAQASQNSASLVARNIRLREQGQPMKRYTPLTGQHRNLPLVISLGKYDGIFVFQGLLPYPLWEGAVFTGFIAALLKEVVEWEWRFVFA